MIPFKVIDSSEMDSFETELDGFQDKEFEKKMAVGVLNKIKENINKFPYEFKTNN